MVSARFQIVVFFTVLCNFLPSHLALAKLPTEKAGSSNSGSLKPSLTNFHKRQDFLNSVSENNAVFQPRAVASFEQASYKSKGRAFIQSLILPGWGQDYAESKTMTKVFIASEVALLGTFLGFTVWSNWLEDDFTTFSVNHAGIVPENKPDDYFVDIGNFDDIFEYNQAQLRDRDVADLYPETEEFFWRWDSRENRLKFEEMRIRSDRAANRAELTLAAVLLNHLVSAIHSTLAVHNFNKRLDEQRNLGLRIRLDRDLDNLFLKLELVRVF